MQYLAHKLHTSRLSISRELNMLQGKGLITLSRGQINIGALEKLIAAAR
ncbi:MAG: helix-turn-helix domain-containing protein [Prevotella sp.]